MSAKDKATGKEQSIVIKASSGLSDEEIEQMIRDAEAHSEEDKKFVSEGGIMLSGLMQMSDTKNGNGRVYPHNILEREIKNYARLVEDRRALGELDHPESSVINLANASHMVTKIWMEGNKCMGTIRVLNTPSGQILRSLVEFFI